MESSTLLALLISGALNIGLYLYRYHLPTGRSSFAWPAQSLMSRLQYVLVYFGSTWIRHSSGVIPLVAGAVGLCAALIVITRTIRQRRAASPLMLQLSLLMLFCIATAAITSSGRLHLGLEQASASRYQTFALVFWCSLGLSLLFHAVKERKSSTEFNALAAFLAVIMLASATQVRMPIIDAQWRQLRLKFISLALISGVHDMAVLADAFPDPQVVLRDAVYMRQHRLSIFAGKQYAQFGQPLTEAYSVRSSNACSGYVSSSQNLPSDSGHGLRLTGYTWNRERRRPASEIVAVENGRIVGFGSSVTIPHGSSHAGERADPSRFGWVAFVDSANPPMRIDLYTVVGRSNEVCRFAEWSP
jgi:hypothetical protein